MRSLGRIQAGGWAVPLAIAIAWPPMLAAAGTEALPKDGAACFAGDAGCRNDAFTIAAALMAADNVHHVVIGRVIDAPSLPKTLGEHRIINARFEVRYVRKPPGYCAIPVRNWTAEGDCHGAPSMPRFVTLRIPSDWFAWPATGTSRLVARLADGHLAGERTTGTPVVRLLEDRRMRLEIGGEYLFALGAERRGADGPYHLPETPDVDPGAEWHFFAGDELDDVDVGLRGIGNCLMLHRDWFLDAPTVPDCMVFARGRAVHDRGNPNLRRH